MTYLSTRTTSSRKRLHKSFGQQMRMRVLGSSLNLLKALASWLIDCNKPKQLSFFRLFELSYSTILCSLSRPGQKLLSWRRVIHYANQQNGWTKLRSSEKWRSNRAPKLQAEFIPNMKIYIYIYYLNSGAYNNFSTGYMLISNFSRRANSLYWAIFNQSSSIGVPHSILKISFQNHTKTVSSRHRWSLMQ